MNSFRVKDTRFRILKGGKIGLAFSIALIGGMLTVGSIKANAIDTPYFTGTKTTTSILTNGISVEKAANVGTNTDTRSDTTTDNVIFAPTSWANSYYTSIDNTTDASSNPAYAIIQTTDYLTLDLTFANGAKANDIFKQGADIYTAPNTSLILQPSTASFPLTKISNSIDYTANLIFQGNNQVTGYTVIGDGNIKLDGNNIIFDGTVNAGSINVAAVGTSTFKSDVDVSTGPVDDLKFTANGTVVLNSDFKGNITTNADNLGTVTLSGDGTGKAQSIIGNIGSSTSLDLGILNIGSDTVSANYSKTTINGDVFADSTVLNNNGTTNSSELIMASGKNITSTITTTDAGKGILTLAGGTQTVSGTVGDSLNKLAEVNAGVNSSTSTFAGDVFATNLDVEGTGTVNLGGDFTGTAIRYNADGTVIVATGNDVNSAITNNTGIDSQGTLTLNGSSTVTGQVGASGASLKEINAGANSSTSTFNSDVYVTNLNMTGSGTVILNSDLTGNVVTTGNQGILTTTGATQTITGNVGSLSSSVNTLNIGSDTVLGNYSTTTIDGNIFATSTVLNNNNNDNGDSTTNSSELILASGKNITSVITTADANMGILTLVGGIQTVTGEVGTNANKLAEINSGANGATSTFVNDVYANTVENIGTGTTTFQDNVVATNVNVNAGTSTFQDNLTATTTTISTGTGNFNTVSGTTTSNLEFTDNGTANLNRGLTGDVTTTSDGEGKLNLVGSNNQTVTGQVGDSTNKLAEVNAGVNSSTSTFAGDVFATNLDVEGTGTVNLGGDFTGTAIRYNADGTVIVATGNDVNSAITNNTGIDSQGTLTLNGSSTVTGQVGASGASLKEINAGANSSTSTFNSDVYVTNLNMTGSGTVILNSDLTGNVVTTGNQGILTTTGATQTITGNVGSLSSSVNTLNIGSDTVLGNYSTTTIDGNIFATSTVLNNNNNDNGDSTTNSSELILASGKNITSVITTADANMGILTLVGGIQTVTGEVGTNANKLAEINSGANGATSTFVNDVYANTVENIGTGTTTFQDNVVATNVNVNAGTSTFQDNLTATTTTISTGTGNFNTVSGTTTSNLQFTNNGIANLNNGLTGNVTTTADNKGTLNLVGSNNQTVTGTVGGVGASLAEVNAGVNGSTSTFANDVYATDITVGNGTVNFEDNVVATTTTIGSGTANFNTTSGTTTTDIVFSNTGTANLLTGLTGDINFSGNNGIVNISDGMGILGSVQTLATNNTGIVNFKGDGTISDSIGSNIYGIKELNINTNNEQNTPNGVLVTNNPALGRELYADVVSLRNNATLTLADGVDIINTGSDNIIITVDNTNTGTLTFQGTSNIEGEVGQSNKVLNTINVGATGKTVTFDDMVYASTLKYSDNGKVVLNGDNSSNTSSEGMIGTVNFDNKAGTLAIGDDVNLTVGAGGTQFINGNNAILEFAGSSIITGILGGNTAGNSTFKRINAGANGETVTFRNDVYVNETTFHVSGTGTVNFQGNLISSLIYDADGVVNVSDGKNIIVSSVPVAVTTATTNTGSLNFLGTTLLATDIGTSTERLKNVTFGSAGSSASTYTQELTKNIYAQNTYIGNGTNQTILEMKNDIIFGGSLTVRANSALDVNTRDITVTDNLSLAANSLTGFKIYTSDITATGSSTGVPSGSITTDTLTIDNNAIIKVNYVGTLYGAGSYNLVSANSILGTYYGTEANGKVSDNSIIDSIIKVDGNNLILFADRTGGGSYGVEDLYIKKSEIGQHYSNGASEALAGYAYDTVVREGALGDVITRIEELDGGLILSSEKKAQMVEMQKLLAPVANNSSIQSSITASNLVLTTIKDRMADMRVSSSTDFIPYGYSGYSSGTYTLNNSLWIKAMGSKATQSKVEDYDGYESTTVGFVAGLDRTLRNGTTIGLAVAQATTKIDQTDFRSGDSSDTQSIQFSTYGSRDFGDTYVDGILSYAKHSTDSTRTANSGKLTSSSDADQISAKVEVGHRVYFEDLATLTPFASLEYGNLNQKGYTEKGTAYQNDALKVDSVKMNKGTLGVGAKLSTNLNVGDNVVIPEFKLAAYNAIGDSNADIKAQYTGGGNQFVTPTQELNKTVYNAGIGVKTTLSESTSLMLGVDYDRSKDGNFEGYSGNVSFRLSF